MLNAFARRGLAVPRTSIKRFCTTSPSAQLSDFESVSAKLKVKELWDWYDVKYSQLKQQGVSVASVKDQASLVQGLMASYPLHNWEPWRWDSLPSVFWADKDFQRKYLLWLGDYIGVQSIQDWYLLRETDITITNGAPLLGMYGTLIDVLKNVLPDVSDWQPWCFIPPPKNIWSNKENHRKFFEWIAKEHNITKIEDWYNLRVTDVRKYGAKLLADKYKDSLIIALQTIFPEYDFLPWRFNHTRKFLWEDMKYQRQYLDWLAIQLKIVKPEDWFFVNPKDIVAHYGTEFLDFYECDFLKALRTVYPEREWKLPEYPLPTNLVWSGKLPTLHVEYLRKILTGLFPNDKIYTNYANDELIDPSANNRMQFDVYLPRYSLAFDFHDEIHFHFSGIFGPSEAHQKRHELKAQTCEKNGITLISIPYWVEERSNYSQFVSNLIKRKRPNLLSEDSTKLSAIDVSYLDTLPNRMAIGTTFKKGKWTFGDALAMPDRWNDNEDPTDYWISEKLDGVRVFWDGQRMYNARGYPIITPDHFRSSFPEHPVEGELYAGPNSSFFVNEAIRTGDLEKWKSIQFFVFDTPEQPQMIYEKRQRVIQYCTVPNENLKLVEVWKCTSKEHLEELYKQVISRGGEGVVLRKPKSHYFDPNVFFKKEPFVDEEVLVWKNQTDGKLNCLSANNKPIAVPVPEKDIPPVGAIISIKSNEEESKDMKMRPDLDWYEVRRQSWNPYRVGYGLPLGLPKCRGCKTILRDRNKPRVMVDCLFYPKFSSPYPGQVAFCLDIECIRKGTFSDCTIHSKDIFKYPQWKGTVGVPGEIWDYLKDEMAKHKQIKWELV